MPNPYDPIFCVDAEGTTYVVSLDPCEDCRRDDYSSTETGPNPPPEDPDRKIPGGDYSALSAVEVVEEMVDSAMEFVDSNAPNISPADKQKVFTHAAGSAAVTFALLAIWEELRGARASIL